ncbi:hypothetical protein GAO09_08795 [Rhizobiales bacterium RZME27]|uniref:Uncharacterized protein n=1 Tax=Endobacterium cereale TaxID=2663029 RepID=A0A6A8A8C5_9HYPH|nr:hypothetical protein [Endobacterium cereale]
MKRPLSRHLPGELTFDPYNIFIIGLSDEGAMEDVMLAIYPELFGAGAIIGGLPYGTATGIRLSKACRTKTPRASARWSRPS